MRKFNKLIKPGKNYKAYNKKKGFDALFFVSLFFSFNNKIKISHKSSLNSRSSTRTI